MSTILVLGTHRSGTSALTGVLHRLGADLPPGPLFPADVHNEAGYWESTEVVAVHDRLLAALGSSWHDPRPLPDGWLDDDGDALGDGSVAVATAAAAVERIVAGRTDRSRALVVKDPRLCRLGPLWWRAIDRADLPATAVLSVRHPAETISSLARREGTSTLEGLWRWLSDTIAAEHQTRDRRRIVASYADLVDGDPDLLAALAAAVGVVAPDGAGPGVDRSLRHQRATAIEGPAFLVDAALAFHDALLGGDDDAIAKAATAAADAGERIGGPDTVVAARPAGAAFGQRATFDAAVRDRDARLSALTDDIDAARRTHEAMVEAATATTARVAALVDELAAAERAAADATAARDVAEAAAAGAERRTIDAETGAGYVRRELDRATARLAIADRRLRIAERSAAVHETNAANLAGLHHERTEEVAARTADAERWRLLLETTQQARSLRVARAVRRVVHANPPTPRSPMAPTTIVASPSPPSTVTAEVDEAAEVDVVDAGLRALLPTDAELAHQRANPVDGPRISVLVPVWRPRPGHLDALLASIAAQTYDRVDTVLVDAGNDDPDVVALLAAAEDAGATVVRLDANLGIAANTNAGLAACTGEYVAFVDHDDELVASALWRCATVLAGDATVDVVYTDHDKVDDDGRLQQPAFKPDWSPELLRGVMYLCHLVVVRRRLVLDAGGLDPTFDGVQDHELALRLAERRPTVAHVPAVLYHWRISEGSVAHRHDAKADLDALQIRAVAGHLARVGRPATVRSVAPHRVVALPVAGDDAPAVSIVIPTRDAADLLDTCLCSIFERTAYPRFDVVLVDTGTVDPRAIEVQRAHPVGVVALPGPFNFSAACNLGAAHSTGDIVVFCNNDIEVLDGDWLDRLAFHLADPDVAAAGATLLYPDGSIQHAGVLLGMRGTADHIGRGTSPDVETWPGFPICAREVRAVTGACLAVRRDRFDDVGGFDTDFAVHYQDVDLCLRLQRGGRRVVVSPTRLLHHESRSRGADYDHVDRNLLLDRWEPELAADPYHHPRFDALAGDHRPLWPAPA